MAYLGSWKIDDFITFYCNTHAAATGIATDADAVPSYRVYEDETGAAIANGNMALLDAANTVGFYSERLQLLAATGFEKGKQYVVYISATVATIEGTTHHAFQIEAEVDANTVSDSVDVASISGDVGAADNLETACDGGAYNVGGGAVVAASVTGNVGGNVVGTVASVVGAVGSVAAAGIAAASFAANAIDANALAISAVNEIRDAILADSTPFNGADIAAILTDTAVIEPLVSAFLDAAISSRATPADITGAHVVTDALINAVHAVTDALIGTRATPADVAAAHAMTNALITALNDPSVAQIVTGIFGRIVEGTLTFEEIERIKYAALAGLSAGGGGDVNRFRDLFDAKDRIRATVDERGNRTAIIVDGTL